MSLSHFWEAGLVNPFPLVFHFYQPTPFGFCNYQSFSFIIIPYPRLWCPFFPFLVSWPHYKIHRRPTKLSSSCPLLSFFCPPPSPLFFGSYSLPLGHLSLSRGLSDLSGGHHGNLHPGHPLLEPLGDPVRLLEVTWGQRVVESYLSSSDLSLSVHPSLWTFNRFATSHTQLQTSAFNSLLAEFRYNCDLLGGNDACSLLSMRKRSFLPYVMVLNKLNWIELN